jgi:hypothetical protein
VQQERREETRKTKVYVDVEEVVYVVGPVGRTFGWEEEVYAECLNDPLEVKWE